MKKRLLGLLLLPFMLIGCGQQANKESYNQESIQKATKTGEIGDFNLTGPENGFVTDTYFTFT